MAQNEKRVKSPYEKGSFSCMMFQEEFSSLFRNKKVSTMRLPLPPKGYVMVYVLSAAHGN